MATRNIPEGALTPVRWRNLVIEKTGLGKRRVAMVMKAMVEIAVDHLERGEMIDWPGLFSAQTWITKPRTTNLPVIRGPHQISKDSVSNAERQLVHIPPRRSVKIFASRRLKERLAKATPPDAIPTREPVANWSKRAKMDALKAEQEGGQA
jgi:nucleoid DNA-binding protein